VTIDEELVMKSAPERRIARRSIFKPRPIRVRRILVTTDFSRPALRAIPYALAVSRHFKAKVHLLHVVDSTDYASKTLALPLVSPAELSRPLMKRLQAVALKFGAAGKIHVLKPREGRVYEEICAAAKQTDSDLIAIATHGYTGLKHAFLGSTAERVIQHSPCPVLVVSLQARACNERTSRLRKILVPIDFSICSQVAFEYGAALAHDFHAELRLVHVIDPHSYPFGDEYAAVDAAQLIQKTRNSAQAEMRRMGLKANVQYSVRVRQGSPAKEICSAANKDVDLIVTSTHGRTGLGHVFIGSVAERIVRCATRPVLVIPARHKFDRTR
jgi:nucleotide-binding universal stress UspA family protein